jgi:hypothetical protein
MLTFIEGAAERAGQLYYRLTRPLRRLAQWARWTLLPRSLETCIECGAPAQWNYVPAGPRADCCDECVPRGCDCNIIDSAITGTTVTETDANGVELVWTDYGDVEPEQRRDKRGGLLPCCDYDFYRWGWPRNQFQE